MNLQTFKSNFSFQELHLQVSKKLKRINKNRKNVPNRAAVHPKRNVEYDVKFFEDQSSVRRLITFLRLAHAEQHQLNTSGGVQLEWEQREFISSDLSCLFFGGSSFSVHYN